MFYLLIHDMVWYDMMCKCINNIDNSASSFACPCMGEWVGEWCSRSIHMSCPHSSLLSHSAHPVQALSCVVSCHVSCMSWRRVCPSSYIFLSMCCMYVHCTHHITSHHITSHHITSHHITLHRRRRHLAHTPAHTHTMYSSQLSFSTHHIISTQPHTVQYHPKFFLFLFCHILLPFEQQQHAATTTCSSIITHHHHMHTYMHAHAIHTHMVAHVWCAVPHACFLGWSF